MFIISIITYIKKIKKPISYLFSWKEKTAKYTKDTRTKNEQKRKKKELVKL